MNDNKLRSQTERIFSRNWVDDLPEDEAYEGYDIAQSLIAEYGWPEVFRAWNDYLHTKCATPEAVVNFAALFWDYCGEQHIIPDPHKFLGYMLYRIDCKMSDYENGDIIEALATSILPKAGYPEADLYFHPYYAADKDPKILAEVEYWRQHNS